VRKVNDYQIVPATPSHARELAAALRQADVDEIFALTGLAPLDGLEYCLASTPDCKAAVDVEGTIVMWGIGVSPANPHVGSPWGLGADRLISQYRLAFLREGLKCAQQGRKAYERLENWVDARNMDSLRFIRWCGFTVHPSENLGYLNLPFHRFTMEGE
jgi:hypothetical protein